MGWVWPCREQRCCTSCFSRERRKESKNEKKIVSWSKDNVGTKHAASAEPRLLSAAVNRGGGRRLHLPRPGKASRRQVWSRHVAFASSGAVHRSAAAAHGAFPEHVERRRLLSPAAPVGRVARHLCCWGNLQFCIVYPDLKRC